MADFFATTPSKVLTDFMIDLAAAMARDDYETRRKRQAQGIEKAKKLGKYRGRKPDYQLRENISLLLSEGKSWSQVQELLGCSRSTVAKVKKLSEPSQPTKNSSHYEC
ncbi:helix-turn-helix domain-containing protein [Vibrio tapetis]|nr:helix-turn-helix domain-containing protein [Vibrio tapetis]